MTEINKPLERAILKLNALNNFVEYVFKRNFIISGRVLAIFLIRDCVMHELSFFMVYKRVLFAVIIISFVSIALIFYYVIEDYKIEKEMMKEIDDEWN